MTSSITPYTSLNFDLVDSFHSSNAIVLNALIPSAAALIAFINHSIARVTIKDRSVMLTFCGVTKDNASKAARLRRVGAERGSFRNESAVLIPQGWLRSRASHITRRTTDSNMSPSSFVENVFGTSLSRTRAVLSG